MRIRTFVSFAALCLAAIGAAHAQTQRTGSADARVMQQLQQVTSERAALDAENAKLKQELEEARKALAGASSAKTTLEQRNRALEASTGRGQASLAQTEAELERLRAQMQELITRFRETAQTLRDVETDRTATKGRLASQERELKTCIDRNAGFYNLNAEVLGAMENRGFWASLAEQEPFTRLKRVELENLIDDYKYRADELRLEQQAQATAPR